MKPHCPSFPGRTTLYLLALLLAAAKMNSPLLAQPTADEFFQSINRSIERNAFESIDLSQLGVFLAAAAVLFLLALLIARWHRRPVKRRTLNSMSKLQRELLRSGAITPAELKKLAAAAQKLGIDNPLLLALCPSLLKQPNDQSTSATNSAA